jgi:nucleotide-binding universal stress UspA family protein/GNAT superfamily N-acetyltransferase
MIRLRDGSRVKLRAIAPEDKELIAGAFERLSDASRYRRFFTVLRQLPPETLSYLTEVDHVDHEAIIAIEPSSAEALGVARYIRTSDDPEMAEVAVTVVDDWQGRGLGRALLSELTRRARQEGVRRFLAIVLTENRTAVKLLRGVSDAQMRWAGSETELVIELPRQRGLGTQLSGLLRAAAAGVVSGGQSMFERALPGSTAEVVRPWRPIETIVVASDGSDSAAEALVAAADLARRFEATLHVVTAYRSADVRPEALSALGLAEQAVRQRGLELQCHARQGEAASVIAQFAGEYGADLIVVGSKGMTGPARLLGSVPNDVSHRAPCSVLIVRTV